MRYGPLSDTGRILLNNFNLFFGKNEDGKTLTIDALVKLLLGRNIRDFEHIDRVEENPEGYIVIESEKGKEIKLPERGDLIKVADLTPSECRNIFIIRNSDLSVARESEFYTNVTDRLTGLKTEEIFRIKNVLREMGKITPTGMFRDIRDEKLKTRLENGKTLLKDIESLDKEIKEKKFDELELECVKLRDEIEEIEKEMEKLEDARKREKYEKGKEALDKLKDTLKKLKDLEVYSEEDGQLWRDRERDIRGYEKKRHETLVDLQKTEEKLKETNKRLNQLEREFRVFEERKKKLDNEIRPELKTYEIKKGELAQQETRSNFFTLIGKISVALLGISLLGTILRPSLFFYILTGIFLISAIISWVFKFQFVKNKAWLDGVFERIRFTLSGLELEAEKIERILSNIQRFDEEYSKKNEELQDAKNEKDKLKEKLKTLRDEEIPKIEEKIKEAKEEIDGIKTKSGEESLKEYTRKLKLKQGLEKLKEVKKGILKNLFEERSNKEENISYWDKEIGSLEEYKDKAKDIKYDEARASNLKKKKQELEKRLEDLKTNMKSIQNKMNDIERKANEILRLEEHLYCKTSVDLEAVRDRLQEFIDKNECNKDNVLKVIEIFEEIETEEREKVSELFGKDSPISKYFNEITNGLYKEVNFNQETGKIETMRNDGVILEAEKLSGGAYDQLYLSIRLALGEKLLKGKKGFFILDDPFIKADPDRLARQIEMMKKISKSGWQVIYFTAKGEVKDTLKEDIRKGDINYVEIRGIFS